MDGGGDGQGGTIGRGPQAESYGKSRQACSSHHLTVSWICFQLFVDSSQNISQHDREMMTLSRWVNSRKKWSQKLLRR